MDARNLDERSESRMSLDLSPIDTELKELARAILEPLDLKLYELEGMSVFEVRPDRFEYGTCIFYITDGTFTLSKLLVFPTSDDIKRALEVGSKEFFDHHPGAREGFGQI